MTKLCPTLLILASAIFWLTAMAGAAEKDSSKQGTPKQTSKQQARKFEKQITLTARFDYLLFLPREYETSDKAWPLILFLHGAGETGSDLEKVKIHGPPKIVESQPEFPFIVVSPQSPRRGWNAEYLNVLLDEILSSYRVDRDRVYLTGLSMGGSGTWDLASLYPERFAAIVPICGTGDPNTAEQLKDLPVWVFHGAKDTGVPLSRSKSMVEAFEKAGGNVRFTVYPDAGHDSWTETYANPELYRWLLQQKRGEGKPRKAGE